MRLAAAKSTLSAEDPSAPPLTSPQVQIHETAMDAKACSPDACTERQAEDNWVEDGSHLGVLWQKVQGEALSCCVLRKALTTFVLNVRHGSLHTSGKEKMPLITAVLQIRKRSFAAFQTVGGTNFATATRALATYLAKAQWGILIILLQFPRTPDLNVEHEAV